MKQWLFCLVANAAAAGQEFRSCGGIGFGVTIDNWGAVLAAIDSAYRAEGNPDIFELLRFNEQPAASSEWGNPVEPETVARANAWLTGHGFAAIAPATNEEFISAVFGLFANSLNSQFDCRHTIFVDHANFFNSVEGIIDSSRLNRIEG